MTATTHADGIRVTKDLKHVDGPHTVIKLTKEQILAVERKRTVLLTAKQLKPLQSLYNKLPRKWAILTSRWDDCTCGIELFAVWCRTGELDVLHDRVMAEKFIQKANLDTDKDSHPSNSASNSEEMSGPKFISENIIIDSKGDMFLNGSRISEQKLRKTIDKMADVKDVERYISFDPPPPISDEIDARILQTLTQFAEYAANKNVNLSAIGFPNLGRE